MTVNSTQPDGQGVAEPDNDAAVHGVKRQVGLGHRNKIALRHPPIEPGETTWLISGKAAGSW